MEANHNFVYRNLLPSQIKYSQDTISAFFDQKSYHSDTTIGETLDDIVEGRCSISDIPQITVVHFNQKWVTRDNRRLWIFKNLERLGMCHEVLVQKHFNIPFKKLNSTTGGESIKIRGGNPGGRWYKLSASQVPDHRRYSVMEESTSRNIQRRGKSGKSRNRKSAASKSNKVRCPDDWMYCDEDSTSWNDDLDYRDDHQYYYENYEPRRHSDNNLRSTDNGGSSFFGSLLTYGLFAGAGYLLYKIMK